MEPRMFDKFLAAAVKAGASDIHIKAGAQPTLRVHGVLKEVKLEALTPDDMAGLIVHMLSRHGLEMDLRRLREYDTSYVVDGVGRFRVNILKQKGHFGAVLRVIPSKVPTLDELGLPPVLKKIAREERGLVLVTGVTGSGKSTTLAAMINEINTESRKHIVTIEDPIEFLHEDRLSRITQREVGADTESFAMALRAALRQDPDVILVGEMRDAVTIDTGLKAAETGHLVFSTVHTNDAAKTIGRIIDVFPHDAQAAVRLRLAENLRATISQRLLRRSDNQGRVVAMEIMISTLTVVELIKDPARTPEIKDYIERSREMYNTQSFDQHLIDLYQAGILTLEVAKAAATNPADFERALYVS
ncbi:MAG: type IV pilus twitching motility protein PilT [Myxococcales bacterium]|nr:type IV pilus twitching motility protein PilT [Myxococcales bacterium]MCB9646712.1 type IV pilus twitching motility protein PilT [Deltaproteobacteria bacterium]